MAKGAPVWQTGQNAPSGRGREKMTLRLRLLLFALLAIAAAVPGAGNAQEAQGETAEPPLALVSTINGAIGPATAKQVADAVATAEERQAAVLIFRIDTPGGLVSSTREIVTDILGSDVPVAAYVWPPGGHAASAGTYIVYATGIAAMAPGTNIGAATPVQMGGMPGTPGGNEDKDGSSASPPSNEEALAKKSTNDAVALIVSLAETHGRNADWAEQAVREGVSLGAKAAKEKGVVELIATDLDDFLTQMDGREVETAAGRTVLHTEGARVETIEPGFVIEILALLSNPNIAFILMLIGVYGLIFELSNPGSFGPGILGTISLLLGLYALNQLPLDYAGLGLVLLGLALMVAEAFTPTLGIVGFGGLIAFIMGATVLIDSDRPEFQLSWWTIGGTAIVSVAILVFLVGYTWRALRAPVTTGARGMTGETARVLEWADGSGFVWAHGERWRARGPKSLTPQAIVYIDDVDGLTLKVSETP
ncbi:MAG: serine protease [Alphaproteobacteria bacterium HGW-Alphaproteobacteria-12]|nr:MAG: serine protease [Alphaproteobacteria bacterium HGW-Alphaproteobacteria-12]